MMDKRVVITGYGIISSIGNNNKDVLHSLQTNKSGVVYVPEWNELNFNSCVGGTIKDIDFDETRMEIGLKSRYMDDTTIYCSLAAMEAKEKSLLTDEQIASKRTSCFVGSGISSTDPIYRSGNKVKENKGKVTPFDVTRGMSSSCSGILAYLFNMKGRSYSICSACATSLHNIGHGYEVIKSGKSDVVMAGGAEEVTSTTTAMFDEMRSALSINHNDDPEKASRPYDSERSGFVISGGAGIVIIEELEHALQRGAEIYGEIVGFGATSDGYDIIKPHPEGDGALRCMKEALLDADCDKYEIDYINTHGTSTYAGDLAEAKSIKTLFENIKVPISSTKSLTGHGLGAAGAQELIYCLLMMQNNFITASANIDNLDKDFEDINIVIKNRETELNTIMTNSFGFGGTNACLIIKKFRN